MRGRKNKLCPVVVYSNYIPVYKEAENGNMFML